MKIGKILGPLAGILSPGLSATGLFGDKAQGVGMGALGAMSPLMAILMALKKKKANDPMSEQMSPLGPQTQGDLMRMAPKGPQTEGDLMRQGLMPFIGPR